MDHEDVPKIYHFAFHGGPVQEVVPTHRRASLASNVWQPAVCYAASATDPSAFTMCFFEMTRFACGDWRWGRFRRRCDHERRLGRTCGLKLIEETVHAVEKCSHCTQIDAKVRRRERIRRRVVVWQSEGRNPASMEQAVQEIDEIDEEIATLQAERTSVIYQIDTSRQL